MDNNEKTIDDVEVGDIVLLKRGRDADVLRNVVRITNQNGKTLYVDGMKFDSRGNLRGDRGGYRFTSIEALTPEQLTREKDRLKFERMVKRLQNVTQKQWANLTMDDLIVIWEKVLDANPEGVKL